MKKIILQSHILKFKELKRSWICRGGNKSAFKSSPAVRAFKACIQLPCSNLSHIPYLVLFVLPGIREAGDDSCDSAGRGNLTGIDHDEQLHQIVIDLPTATLHNVDVLPTNALAYFHAGNRWEESCNQRQIKAQPFPVPAEQPRHCIPQGLGVTLPYNQGCWAGTLLFICSGAILQHSLITFNGPASKAKSTQPVLWISTRAEHVNTSEQALLPGNHKHSHH